MTIVVVQIHRMYLILRRLPRRAMMECKTGNETSIDCGVPVSIIPDLSRVTNLKCNGGRFKCFIDMERECDKLSSADRRCQ